MEDNVTSDAVKLAKNILNSLLSNQKRTIVNIAIDSRDTFVLDGYPSIPPSFGYKYNKTPILLKQYGSIEGETAGWWAMRTSKKNSYWDRIRPPDLAGDDKIIDVAYKMGYIKQDKIIEYYYREPDDIGPRMHGQFAILINTDSLDRFIKEYGNTVQVSEASNNEVWYKGFKFSKEKNILYLPPYGKCEFSLKNVPSGIKVNQRALLVDEVTTAGEAGISSNKIREQFKKAMIDVPDNRRIDAMMDALNKRFDKEFSGAKVAIINIGSQGVKRIKLSVRPLSKK